MVTYWVHARSHEVAVRLNEFGKLTGGLPEAETSSSRAHAITTSSLQSLKHASSHILRGLDRWIECGVDYRARCHIMGKARVNAPNLLLLLDDLIPLFNDEIAFVKAPLVQCLVPEIDQLLRDVARSLPLLEVSSHFINWDWLEFLQVEAQDCERLQTPGAVHSIRVLFIIL